MLDLNQQTVNNIRDLRLLKNISQAEIAKALNLTPTAYNRIENNSTQLTINNLFNIAKKLDVGVDELLHLQKSNAAHNIQSIIMSQFINGTLHIAIPAGELMKLAEKDNLSKNVK